MPGIARHTPTLAGYKAARLILVDAALLPHVGELLGQMTLDYNWVEIGDPVDDIVTESLDTLMAYYGDIMIGSVSAWIVDPPDGYLLLDGTTYAQVDYPELFSVLPTQLISGTNFTLPDMTSVFMAGTDTVGNIGDLAGDNSYNLTVGQLPAHSHLYTPPTLTIEAETPTTPLPTAGIGSPIQTGNTGSGDSIDNRPEHIAFMYAVYAGRV